MQCMEIWGGNQTVDNAVVMSGLDAWVYSKPYGQSADGGDVYYVSSCATGRITRLLLADVSGHGQVVAETANCLRRLMQKYVNYIDQSAFVTSMNQHFSEMSAGGCFATAIVSTFFAPTRDLTLCIAGHPPPLLYRAKEKRWSFLSRCDDEENDNNLPLGIVNDSSEWTQFGVRLEIGDLVLAYTDSLIESHGSDGEMLGMPGLLSIASEVDGSDASRVTSLLLAAIAARYPENLTKDDVTVLLFRPNGTGGAVPVLQKIFAPFRVLRGAVGSILSDGKPMPWPEVSLANIGGILFAPLGRFRSKRNQRAGGRAPTI